MASPDRSILSALEASGHSVPRVRLRDPGTEASPSDVVLQPADERYVVLGEIAVGGVGRVVKGRDVDLGRDVALKVLRQKHVADGELVRRFVEEAQVGGQLAHPGIVPVYELGMDEDELPFFAMKLVKGETLAALLKGRADPSKDQRRFLVVFEQVCRTLAYAHSRGVVHRDVKPSNVMVGAFGEVQVIDWGFAKVLPRGGIADEAKPSPASAEATVITTVRTDEGSSASIAGSIMGTPAYMPPEQALGQVEDLDERSDVFSLGAILCEVLTGEPPYVGEDLLPQAARADLEDARWRLDACDAPEEVVDLARRCLAPSRIERPKSAAILADTLGVHLEAAEQRAHQADLDALKEREQAAAARTRQAEAQTEAEAARREAEDERAAADLARARSEAARAEAERSRRRRRQTLMLAGSLVLVLAAGAGSLLFVQRDRATRRAKTAHEVEEALSTAVVLREREQWVEATAELRKAASLAQADGTSVELRARVATAREALQREHAAAEARDRQRAKDAAMVATLEAIHLDSACTGGQPHERRALDDRYVLAFAEYGLDLDALTTEEATSRVESSEIRDQLTVALEGWLFWRLEGSLHLNRDYARIRVIVDALDPDTVFSRLRHASVERDLAALREVADSIDPESLPPARLVRLAIAYGQLGAWAREAEIFERGIERFPAHVPLYIGFSNVLRHLGRDEEGLRYATCAAALRPDRLPVRTHLSGFLQRSGDLEASLEVQREIARLDPLNPDHKRGVMGALKRLGKLDDEMQRLEKQLEAHDEDADLVEYLLLAYIYERRLDDAKPLAQKLVELRPHWAPAYTYLGVVLSSTDGEDAALAAYETSLRMDPSREETPRNVAARLSRRRFDEAWPRFLEMLPERSALAKEQFLLHYATQRSFWGSHGGGHEDALAANRELARLRPESFAPHHNMGISYLRVGEQDKGLASLRKAVEIAPTSAATWKALGSTCFGMGRFEEAAKHLRRALQLQPQLGSASMALMDILIVTDRKGEAVRWFRERAGANPTYDTFLRLGQVLRKSDEAEAAIPELQRALELRPHDRDAHIWLAIALSDAGRPEEACDTVRAVLGRSELADHRIHHMLGMLHLRERRNEAAFEAFRDALEAASIDGYRQRNFAYAAAICRGEDDAETLGRESFSKKNPYWEAHLHAGIGEALYAQGDLEGAIRRLRKALDVQPQYAFIRLLLAQMLRLQGEASEATELLGEILGSDPLEGMSPSAAGRVQELGECEKEAGRFAVAEPLVSACLDLNQQPIHWSRRPMADYRAFRKRQLAEHAELKRLAVLEPRTADILAGDVKPDGARENLDFAKLCLWKGHHAKAVPFFVRAFELDPALAEDLHAKHRFLAAQAAARGGRLDLALQWLQADLPLWREELEARKPYGRTIVNGAYELWVWKAHKDLAPVRDETALAAMSVEERAAWQKHWAEVDALIEKHYAPAR